jgi:acetyltransferase-like isoleucine patch superfamily enzyme
MKIDSTAIVSAKATIGENVSIGPFTLIHDNVIIKNNSIIGSHCVIGFPNNLAKNNSLVIGEDSLIRSHSILYAGSVFVSKLETGHHVTIRENTYAGINLRVGTQSDIQGDCSIGDYVRMHSNVHIGKASKIQNYVWIFPYVVLTNDPRPPSNILLGVEIEDYAVIATMATILPGIKIGRGSLVGAGSIVNRDVAPNSVVVGNPAKHIANIGDIKFLDSDSISAYPWKKHFHDGYPKSVIEGWMLEED